MTQKQARRWFIVALVLSLLIHIVAVTFVRWPFHAQNQPQAAVHVMRVRQVRIARLPSPPPPTPPPPAPTAAPTARPPVRAKRRPVSSAGIHPVESAGPAATPAAPARAPRPSATPACSAATTPVLVAASPPPPEIPAAARGAATSGTARVDVAVSATGAVTAASLAQSSGNAGLDRVALEMARTAGYAPATRACKPVAGSYTYAVRFSAW